jgi:bacteriocin biosynthesis cyclodehydratase domain-containing protein
VAESVVVSDPVLVVAFDPWADQVATTISRALADPVTVVLDREVRGGYLWATEARPWRLGIVVMSRIDDGERFAGYLEGRVAAWRAAFEDEYVTYLTVERDRPSVWVGPTVVPFRPGCHGCWLARRRQHAETLSGGQVGILTDASGAPDPAPAPLDIDSVRLAVKTALAVTRRVLASPDAEAGVVRRFSPGGATQSIGRVVPVAGCARCDRSLPAPAGWSLHPRVTAGAAITENREEVKS